MYSTIIFYVGVFEKQSIFLTVGRMLISIVTAGSNFANIFGGPQLQNFGCSQTRFVRHGVSHVMQYTQGHFHLHQEQTTCVLVTV
jgi:hypothetical protein